MADLADRTAGRIVSCGSALALSAVWDGYDLLAEFGRQATITV